MSVKNIRRIALAVLVCSMMSAPAGKCKSAAQSEVSQSLDLITICRSASCVQTILHDSIGKIVWAYRDYRVEVANVKAGKFALGKLKNILETGTTSSSLAMEESKLEAIFKRQQALLVETQNNCKQCRERLIDLVGTAAVGKVDESLKPEF